MTSGPAQSKVSDALEFLAAKALAEPPAGDVELSYSASFASAMAEAYESGDNNRVLAADAIERKLKKRFGKDFNSTQFRSAIKLFRTEIRLRNQETKPPHQMKPVEGVDLRPYTMTDDGNADRLIALHGGNIKYCGATNSWMIWDGRRWQADNSYQIQVLVVSAMKELAKQSENDLGIWEHAQQSMNARAIESAIKLARAKCPADADRFDTNPWLLNFQNGTVNLRTGELRDHERGDLLTVLIERKYNPKAECPKWCKFLEWAMGGGPDASAADQDRADRFVAYLQRALGYSLTGSSAEKVVFLLWGPQGNNGKSTLLDIVRMLIGDYGGQMAVGSLMTRKHESNAATSDVAGLKGKRFVQTTETKGTQVLDISVLKSLSAGMGEVHARRMRENWIKFQATHTIWIDMNKPPRLEELDDPAALGRLDLIKFNQTIEKGQEDKQFSEQLVKSEGEGILAWLVKGSILWCSEQALQRPPEVITEREAWQEDMDTAGPWTGPISRYIEAKEKEFKTSQSYHEGEEFSFSIEDLLTEAIKKPIQIQTRNDQTEAGKIVTKLGPWDKFRGPRPDRPWLYKRPVKPTP